jgi:hypothetical protein
MLALALSVFLFLFPLAAGPPSLHEIGRDRDVPGACGPLVVHANAAISAQTRAHAVLTRAIARLRTIDGEANALTRRTEVTDLTRLSAELNDAAGRGDDELHRMSDAATRIARPRGAAVDGFTAPLATAFAIEHRAAVDLASFVNYLDYLDLHENLPSAEPGRLAPVTFDPGPAGDLTAPQSPYKALGTPDRMARSAASDFAARLTSVESAENRAGQHGDEAVGGCA